MAGTPPTPPNDDLNAAVNNLKDFQGVVGQVTSGLKEMFSTITGIKEGMGDVNGEFKETINAATTVAETMEEVIAATKKFGSKLPKLSYKDAKKEIDSIIASSISLQKNTKKNSAEYLILARTIKTMSSVTKEYGDELSKSGGKIKDNEKLMLALQEATKDTAHFAASFAKSINGIKIDRVTRSAKGLAKALNAGRVSSVFDRAADHTEKKGILRKQREENSARFNSRVASLINKHPDFVTNGELDWKRIGGDSNVRKDVLESLLGPHASGRNLKLGERMLSKGGGRLLRRFAEGDGSAALGTALSDGALVEGILANPVTMWAGAGIEAAKATFDATAKKNKEVEERLGKGGIFTGNNSAFDTFANVRNNLLASGLGKYGISTERQMGVAQTIQDSGLGISNLANRGGMGYIGGIGDIVFKESRELGLNDVEGTKEVIKMLQQYHMTMTGTKDFFRTVGRDINAAGLSTSKYLQLIDDVTSQFSDMGKSIGNVTSLLRSMSAVGTNTYENLKENMEGIIGKDDKTPEQSALLYQLMGHKGQMQLSGIYEDNASTYAANYADTLNAAMKEAGVKSGDADNIRKIFKEKGMSAATQAFQMADKTNNSSASAQNLESIEKQYENAKLRARAAASGNPITWGFLGNISPNDVTGTTANQLAGLSNMFKIPGGKGFGDFVGGDDTALNGKEAIIGQLGKQFGVNSLQNVFGIRQGMQNVLTSMVKTMGNGAGLEHAKDVASKDGVTLDTNSAYNTLAKIAEQSGESSLHIDRKGDVAKQVQALIHNPATMTTLLSAVYRYYGNHVGEFNKVINSRSAESQIAKYTNAESYQDIMQKVAEMSRGTKTTDDYIKDMRDALVDKVAVYLDQMLSIFTEHWGTEAQKVAAGANSPIIKQNVDFIKKVLDRPGTGNITDKLVTDVDEWGKPRNSGLVGRNLKQSYDAYEAAFAAEQADPDNTAAAERLADAQETMRRWATHLTDVTLTSAAAKGLHKSGAAYDPNTGQVVDAPAAGSGQRFYRVAPTPGGGSDPNRPTTTTINNTTHSIGILAMLQANPSSFASLYPPASSESHRQDVFLKK